MSDAVQSDARRSRPIEDAGTFPGLGGARHFDYGGISGFSTTNFGWMAAALVGGIVFAWRLAGRPQSRLGVLRPRFAPAAAHAVIFVPVTLSGVIFLGEQPVVETMTTDAQGRAFPTAFLVLVVAVAVKIILLTLRRTGRLGRP